MLVEYPAMNNFWQNLKRPILALAPMVGVSDSPFRQQAKNWGADVVYSEMIAAEALIRQVGKATRMMLGSPAEQPLVVQLMGNKPESLARAAQIAEDSGAAGVDINFGCPAHKIARNYCGAMLMRDLDLSRQLIEATIKAVKIPVSIKVRTSIKADTHLNRLRPNITILDFLNKIKDLPIAAVMVHGRSFEDPFDGPINLNVISEVKKIFHSGPVLANGGLTTIESAKEILETTGADGLGLARSTLGKPWIFKQIRQYLDSGSYQELGWPDISQTMQEHAQAFYEFYDGYFQPMRHHLSYYVRGLANASALRQQLQQTNSPQEVARILELI